MNTCTFCQFFLGKFKLKASATNVCDEHSYEGTVIWPDRHACKCVCMHTTILHTMISILLFYLFIRHKDSFMSSQPQSLAFASLTALNPNSAKSASDADISKLTAYALMFGRATGCGMKFLLCLVFLAPLIAVAGPSKKDKEEVSNIVERSGTILGGLIECDQYDMRDDYLESLKDALRVYPGTDPVNVRALIRRVEAQGAVISKLGIKSIPSPTAEDLDQQKRMCGSQILDAKRDIRALDNFILK
jgi:hypothetical protein